MRETSVTLNIDAILTNPDKHIIVCTGSGGVGKTTTAAALGLRAAELGRNVCVLTIDPARRLAQAMGLTELDNTPRPVPGISNGALSAMMLDMKRTFDEVVESHSDPERAQKILSNPFYEALSSSFAGTQEYMAMEKLGQLRADESEWDLIIVDTPPSRNALDFLDAPARLGSFLDGRLIRIITAPARGAGRGIGRIAAMGFGIFTNVLSKLLGAQVLADVGNFVADIDTTFGGFRERADATYALLKDSGTEFIVVAAPERDALREASYFVERLNQDGMPLGGLILNRVQEVPETGLTQDQVLAAAQKLTAEGTGDLTASLLELHAQRMEIKERQKHLALRFTAAHPTVPVQPVPAMSQDVHDLAGLREIGAALANQELKW
ncbi:MAG: ArsA family ATPase [Actinomycetia bacterium]|nr:ArsA family ATPase [Actinomycetes bacterium]MCH9738610.1 ArsA family ATPase [Actinomycetes bacterium]MCH9830358.1 ArsA family ATPase [Actinomycetes bacterium]MCH9840416.1 ArsA family ATPase [Actinomycetes bacterium]